MKCMMPCLLILTLSLPARADDKDADARTKTLFDASSAVVQVMKGVKDKASAEKAKGDLETALTAYQKARDAFQELPEEQRKKLQKVHEARFTALHHEFVKEGNRLQDAPGVMSVLGQLAPFKQAREAKRKRTLAQIQAIDKAAQTFRLTTGDYPKSIEVLTTSPGDGIKPYLIKEVLKDSWGRTIQYDLKGARNKGVKPDIWSLGPLDQKNALIGNWE